MKTHPITGQYPSPGRIVHYQTDERGGLRYILPAIITCTADTHPSVTLEPLYRTSKPVEVDGTNPVTVPLTEQHGQVHLTVFTPGSGAVYNEDSVPYDGGDSPAPRTWHWPPING